MQTLCSVICFIYADKADLSYVSRGKLLCCVNPVARESKAHNRDGGQNYRSNAHRTGGVCVGEQEEQRHVRHDLL